MKDLLCEVVTNKLGNVLALINLSLIALHAAGVSEQLGLVNLIRLSFLVNVPSRLMSAILFNDRLMPYWTAPSTLAKYSLISLVFIYFQWTAIGWITQRISRAIQAQCVI